MQDGRPSQHEGQGHASDESPEWAARVGPFSQKEDDMQATSRHCAHNDKRRIRELERIIDRLVIALGRYGIHKPYCKRQSFDAILDSPTVTVACSCGLTALIETRGEL